MERIWNYGGRAYAFDITESSCISRIAKALADQAVSRNRWFQKWNGKTDSGSLGTMISEHCAEVRRFFDALFGSGEGVEIAGNCDSAQSCDEAYYSFIAFVKAQIDTFSRVREETERYYRERLDKIAGRSGKAETDGDSQ